jgi:recombination protein RecT
MTNTAPATAVPANGTIEKAKPKGPMDLLKEGFQKWRPVLRDILPKHIDSDRVIRIAMNAYMNSPQLIECTPRSMVRATLQCAELGLDPSPLLGEAYFIPFNNKVRVKDGKQWIDVPQLEVQLMPGYLGLVKLVKQTGDVADVYAVVVDESERKPVFDSGGRLTAGFYVEQGTERRIQHIQSFDTAERKPFACYGVVKYKDGTNHFEVFNRQQIEAIRTRSKSFTTSPKTSPWMTDEEAMWKKTMIKQATKTSPKSPEKPGLATAIAIDNAAELGESFRSDLLETFDAEGELEPAQLQQNTRTDALLGKLGVPATHDADGVLVEGKK